MIGFVARYPHLRRHLQPIVDGLIEAGLEVEEGKGDLTLCAARYDVEQCEGPVVLVEHGAGQTYRVSDRIVDAGATGKEAQSYPHVVGYVGPNRELCDLMRTWLPNAVLIVASPLIEAMRRVEREPQWVTFAVHWPSTLASRVPEAGTSWPHSAVIAKVIKPDVIHGHPRIQHRMRRDLKQRRITAPLVEDWNDIWPRTKILVVDNSSILWEAAAVGIDVALIHPAAWTGRHGLRFGWQADPLLRVNESNAAGLREMDLPKPAGSPYEQVEGSIERTVEAVKRLLDSLT